MHDSEELPDDVPSADAADQQRAVSRPEPDKECWRSPCRLEEFMDEPTRLMVAFNARTPG